MSGRAVVVTGAASGFGRATAAEFGRQGDRVLVADRDGDGAREVAASLPGAVAHVVDLTDPRAAESLIERAYAELGTLDVLVNNAGAGRPSARMVDVEPSDFDGLYALNLRAAFVTSTAAAHRMPDGAVIINVASMGGRRPRPGATVYNSAKAGMIAMTQAMAVEFAPRVRFHAVNPTGAETPFLTNALGPAGLTDEMRAAVVAGIPMGRLATVDDVAAAILYFASPECGASSGEYMDVDGGRSIQ